MQGRPWCFERFRKGGPGRLRKGGPDLTCTFRTRKAVAPRANADHEQGLSKPVYLREHSTPHPAVLAQVTPYDNPKLGIPSVMPGITVD